VAGLVADVQTAVTSVTTALTALQGTGGTIAQAIGGTLTGVGGVLAGLDLGSATGSVTLTGLDLSAVSGLISGPGAVLSDGVVTLDLADPDGTILVDLAGLVGGPDQLNDLAPNTELVINAAVIHDILTRVGALVQAWVDEVREALLAAISAVAVHVDLTTSVGISSLGIDIISVAVELDTDLGELLVPDATPPTLDVTATALDLGVLGAVVAGVLSGLGLGSLSSLVTGINTSATLPGALLAAIGAAASTALGPITSTFVTDATSLAAQLATALGAVLDPLPTVLSVMVNVQPDLPGAPPGVAYVPADPPATSQEYRVTALRIGLLGGVGAPVFVDLATASAGANSRLPCGGVVWRLGSGQGRAGGSGAPDPGSDYMDLCADVGEQAARHEQRKRVGSRRCEPGTRPLRVRRRITVQRGVEVEGRTARRAREPTREGVAGRGRACRCGGALTRDHGHGRERGPVSAEVEPQGRALRGDVPLPRARGEVRGVRARIVDGHIVIAQGAVAC
jgi:hypothetical protein